MNNFLKPDFLYLVLLLVMPGLLSQTTFNSLVARGKDKQVDIYQSILHSIIIYVILYPLIVLAFGVEIINTQSIISLTTGSKYAPILSIIIVGTVSICWGWVYSKFYRSNILKRTLGRFGGAYEPPNLYAEMIVEKYQSNEHLGSSFWIVVKNGDNGFIEGRVEKVAVESKPREFYITSVAYLDSEREPIRSLPNNTGIILKLDDFDVVEITEIKQEDQLG